MYTVEIKLVSGDHLVIEKVTAVEVTSGTDGKVTVVQPQDFKTLVPFSSKAYSFIGQQLFVVKGKNIEYLCFKKD